MSDETTNRNIYFTPENLTKLDNARGQVKRSTLINLMIEKAEVKWLKEIQK